MSDWARTMDRVAVIPWSGIEGAFLCVSGRLRNPSHREGPKWKGSNHGKGDNEPEEEFHRDWDPEVEPVISFTFIDEEAGTSAEWDGHHGPVQLFFRAEKDDEGAREHWLWEWATGAGHWSQLAVGREDLPMKFNQGEYEAIFRVLREWAKRDDPTED